MVGATRRVARYRAARRAAPTFRNDEVEAQRRRWTFYETIKFPPRESKLRPLSEKGETDVFPIVETRVLATAVKQFKVTGSGNRPKKETRSVYCFADP